MVEVIKLDRVFEFNGKTLTDPNPEMTPSEVVSFYSNEYPEMATAKIGLPKVKEEKQVFSITTQIGTKG